MPNVNNNISEYFFNYTNVLLFLLVGVAFVFVSITFSRILARLLGHRKPDQVKQSTYECGEIPIGTSFIRFNIRFYVVALIFIIFDVEVVALFPWAVIFRQSLANKSDALLMFIEMFVFVLILIVGLIYVWRKGDLQWVKTLGERHEKEKE